MAFSGWQGNGIWKHGRFSDLNKLGSFMVCVSKFLLASLRESVISYSSCLMQSENCTISYVRLVLLLQNYRYDISICQCL